MLQASLELITDLSLVYLISSWLFFSYFYDLTLSPLILTHVSLANETISRLILVSNSKYVLNIRRKIIINNQIPSYSDKRSHSLVCIKYIPK